jgi:DNA-binding winged helix-turn-helix (wHTH) protein
MRSTLIEPQENRQPTRRHHASMTEHWPKPAAASETLEFGCFQVSLRRRELLCGAVPIELGTRAFDVLLVLLEADGALVTKKELLNRVWPSVVVAEDNLKVQISALRKVLGEHRNFIRTEFGRGYRFTATIHSNADRASCRPPTRRRLWWRRRPA